MRKVSVPKPVRLILSCILMSRLRLWGRLASDKGSDTTYNESIYVNDSLMSTDRRQ